jgi:hypothetical protein
MSTLSAIFCGYLWCLTFWTSTIDRRNWFSADLDKRGAELLSFVGFGKIATKKCLNIKTRSAVFRQCISFRTNSILLSCFFFCTFSCYFFSFSFLSFDGCTFYLCQFLTNVYRLLTKVVPYFSCPCRFIKWTLGRLLFSYTPHTCTHM